MRTLFWAALVLVVGACGTKDQTVSPPPDTTAGGGGAGGVAGGSGTGGSEVDATPGDDVTVVEDSADEPASCGMMSCKLGEYCCDGACGACAPIGTNCPMDPCGGGGGG